MIYPVSDVSLMQLFSDRHLVFSFYSDEKIDVLCMRAEQVKTYLKKDYNIEI